MITYNNNDIIDVEKFEINVAVGNGPNIKWDLKGSVNMKMQGVETLNLAKVIYIPQAVKNLLSIARLVSKGSMMGDTQDKMTMKKNYHDTRRKERK